MGSDQSLREYVVKASSMRCYYGGLEIDALTTTQGVAGNCYSPQPLHCAVSRNHASGCVVDIVAFVVPLSSFPAAEVLRFLTQKCSVFGGSYAAFESLATALRERDGERTPLQSQKA